MSAAAASLSSLHLTCGREEEGDLDFSHFAPLQVKVVQSQLQLHTRGACRFGRCIYLLHFLRRVHLESLDKHMQHATTTVKPRLRCQRRTLLAASAKCCGGRRGTENKSKEERLTKFLASLNTEKTEGFATALCDRQWRVGLVSSPRAVRRGERAKGSYFNSVRRHR